MPGRPRTRGGHPAPDHHCRVPGASSPHTRGSSRHTRMGESDRGVVPAHAGVIPSRKSWRGASAGRPRTRGGHPTAVDNDGGDTMSSPHTRGSSHVRPLAMIGPGVVPAHAGVIPRVAARSSPTSRRPRTRGGHPGSIWCPYVLWGSSPHTRGSSRPQREEVLRNRVVPAHAGVILPTRSCTTAALSRPRTRGGHPQATDAHTARKASSPHTRGSS